MHKFCDVSVLKGLTLKSVTGQADDDEIIFETEDGRKFKMFHMQSCCESVYVEGIVGDWNDIIGSPLLVAEEVSGEDDSGYIGEYGESYTWTFYKFATIKGYVDIRWYGTSNGYYSESVDFEEIY